MVHSGSTIRGGAAAFYLALASLAMAACAKPAPADENATQPPTEVAPAPAADNIDTLSGVTLAAYTGDAAKGASVFTTCQTCHAVEEGVNKIGPSLHGIIGRDAGTIATFTYSPANKNSGIRWTPEKLFQYLERPQRVVPGTKMVFAGIPDPQKRADLIAYLQSTD